MLTSMARGLKRATSQQEYSEMMTDEEYEAQREQLDLLKEKCLYAMTSSYKMYEDLVAAAGGDTEEFSMLILEQWRPW